MNWINPLSKSPAVSQIIRAIDADGRAVAIGRVGSSTTVLTALLQRQRNSSTLLVLAHLDDADEAVDELTAQGITAERLPALESTPDDTAGMDLLAERLSLLQRLHKGDRPQVLVAPIQSLMQAMPTPTDLDALIRTIRPGDTIDQAAFVGWLADAGYTRVQTLESPGEFAVRGGIIDVFPFGEAPWRIDLFGDDVDRICEIDLDTMASDRRLDEIRIASMRADMPPAEPDVTAMYLPPDGLVILDEVAELQEQARSYYDRVIDAGGVLHPSDILRIIGNSPGGLVEVHHASSATSGNDVTLPVSPLPMFTEHAREAIEELGTLARQHDVLVLCQNDGEAARMNELAEELPDGISVEIGVAYVHRGLIWQDDEHDVAIVPYHELMNRFQTRRRIRRIAGGRAMDTFLDIEPGDFVVHRDHGIGRFLGLQMLDSRGDQEEFLSIEFAKGAKVHVPVSKISLVQRYVGAFKGRPELSTIGGKRWSRQKENVEEAVRDLASEMLRVQAAREAMPGIRYPADTTWQREFVAEFPYEETDDQLTTIDAVKRDMSNARPMDRLICGDVGFGKTEVAIRAAFKAAEFGRQVAVLVPTTVLAEQHERSFKSRFADYPFVVESLSRFKTRKEQTEVLGRVKKGQVDIVIGTHRLLSADVKFADLGLVCIDEEQRFGVEHKQRLLEFRLTADVLTLSATPIPRTLHMSMLGLRDISSLTTPPLDRRAIVTEVLMRNKHRIQTAIDRELAREGQVFFVHNRVHDIHEVAQEVQQLAPDARIVVGHGQMPGRELEKVMLRFIRRDADILVCTTIIESGIDIPTANTMFIDDAQNFGLAELHQLRGRVGRHKHRAYCYLLLPEDRTINPVAVKRLRAIEAFSMLGAGFKIAMRDLEIRGAGNLLGAEQSGHIAAVGYEMYCQLLQQAVQQLKDPKKTAAVIDTTIDIGITAGLPRGYIPADSRRMDAYRRICQAQTPAEIEKVERDLESAYGELPTNAERLIRLAEIRIAATMLGVQSIRRHDNDIIFKTNHPTRLTTAMTGAKGTLRAVGTRDAQGLSEIYYRPPKRYLEADSLITVLRTRLAQPQSAEERLLTPATQRSPGPAFSE